MVLDKSASPDKVLASKTELTKQQMHEDGEDFISGIIGFEDLRLFPFITGKLVTFRYF